MNDFASKHVQTTGQGFALRRLSAGVLFINRIFGSCSIGKTSKHDRIGLSHDRSQDDTHLVRVPRSMAASESECRSHHSRRGRNEIERSERF